MVQILDLVLESTVVFFSQCLQNAWAALSDWQPWYCYQMPPQRSLASVFPLLPLLSTSSRSWPMPCASTRPSHNFTFTTMTTRLVMRESRPRGRSGRSLEDHREHRDPRAKICSRDEFGALSRYESRIYPSATQRLIMAWGYPSACVGFSGSSLQHWQALAAALEANKTIKDVGLSDDELTDEGKQASLLGIKKMKSNWVVLVGARFIRLASQGARKHLTDCWYNIMYLQSILSSR